MRGRRVLRPSRIAGGLLIVQDSSKLELLRGVTFLWCARSALAALVVLFNAELWLHALFSLLFAASIAGLMLDGLGEPAIAILTLLGFGVLFF